jgi:hypothetical protein
VRRGADRIEPDSREHPVPEDGDITSGNGRRLADLHAARQLLVEDDEERVALAGGSGAQQIGDYLLDRRVGQGGAGSVYHARHVQTGRVVAVKLLTQRLGESPSAARAWRELQILSQLRLACLPRLLDYGEHEGRLYLVSEYIEGSTLARHCDERNLSRRERVQLLAQVAEALHELHGYGVIHRDIKPDNVIVDENGRPFIVDLGLASILGDDLTRTITEEGVPVGSPAFMSPEQARGEMKALSALSDVYSLGATAYFILTGDTPHDTRVSVHEAIRRVAQEPPRDVRSLSAATPRPLAAVLGKCVAQAPAARYASARAFAEDLRRWLRGDAVEATPPSAAQKLGRFVGRHPAIATLAVCIMVALSALIALSAGIAYVGMKPQRVTISHDWRVARLVSRAEATLHRWEFAADNAITLAELGIPASGPHGRHAVWIGHTIGASGEYMGELCAFDADSPDELLWRSGTTAASLDMATSGRQLVAGDFVFSNGILADIYPDVKGPEIIAVHRHAFDHASCIRVLDQSGQLLQIMWHKGHIIDVAYVPSTGLLYCVGASGHAGSTAFSDATDPTDPTATPPPWPHVLFAVPPRQLSKRTWVDPVTAASSAGGFYKRLSPLSQASSLYLSFFRFPNVVEKLPSRDEVLTLEGRPPNGEGNMIWSIHRNGEVGHASASDTYSNREGVPNADVFKWVDYDPTD